MPQLDPTFFPSQIFWLIVSFGLLYFLSRLLLIPKIQRILERREHRISEDKKQAEFLKEQTEEVSEKSAAVKSDAQLAARDVIKESHSKTRDQIAGKETALQLELDRKLSQESQAIHAEKEQALLEMHSVVESLAGLSTEFLANPTQGAHQRAKTSAKASGTHGR